METLFIPRAARHDVIQGARPRVGLPWQRWRQRCRPQPSRQRAPQLRRNV